MKAFEEFLSRQLEKRKAEGNFRQLSRPANLIDFVSNDYLGLARSHELAKSVHQKLQSAPYRNGATGSRLLSGNTALAEELELKLAKIFNAESALLFTSGYAANTGLLSSIASKDDTIVYDELSHASIKDGVRLSLAKRFSFRHNDLDDLKEKLLKAHGRKYVVVESVYSMDGDTAPLQELVELSKEIEFTLIVDEAHSTGIFGHQGSGLCCQLGIEDQIDIRIFTFGKAIGTHGACVVGSKNLSDYLVNFARPFIYTTALPVHTLLSIESAFEMITDDLRKKLFQKIDLYDTIDKNASQPTPIKTAIISGNDRVKHVARILQQNGFDVRPILSPTVPLGKERIRICLHTFNEDEHIINLRRALSEFI